MPFCQVTLTALRPEEIERRRRPENIAEHLRKRRLHLGLKQDEVARWIGVNVASIHNWETGKTDPAVRYLPKVIDFLGYYPYPIPNTVGGKLVAARHHLGLSRKALAKRLDVDEATLRAWEHGRREPGKKYQDRINELLEGVTLYGLDES